MTSHDATVLAVEGYAVVERTDDVIWVTNDLWREIVETADHDLERGHAVVDVDGGTIALGTPGRGLGRITYRFVEHRHDLSVYVYERIPE